MTDYLYIADVKEKEATLVNYYSSVDLANMVIRKDVAIKRLKEKLIKELAQRDSEISKLKEKVKMANRKCVGASERKLNIELVNSATSKLTINPCSGRCSLKIATGCSLFIKNKLTELAEEIMEYTFDPFTVRGKFKHDKEKMVIKISLKYESKRMAGNFKIKID